MRLLLLLLYMGASLGNHGNNYQNSGHACCVRPQYTTPYVSAFHHEMTMTGGCNSNQTTPSTHKQVHIIRYGGNSQGSKSRGRRSPQNSQHGNRHTNKIATPVVLRIEPRLPLNVHDGSVVLLLWSKNPVKWTIEMERIGNSSRYKFVLPKHSRIASSKSLPVHVRVQKYDDLPRSLEGLAQWVEGREGAVTSVSDVPGSSVVLLHVGIDPSAPLLCQLGLEAPGSSTAPASAISWKQVETSACAARWNEGYQGQDVHVIEVRDTPHPSTPGMPEKLIQLIIKSKTPPVMAQPIRLVLKAPKDTIWKIDVTRFRGDLNIITNSAGVEAGDWPRQDIMTTREDLTDSGQQLVNWVANSYGHPVSYTEAATANRFMLFVDGGEYLTYVVPNIGGDCPTTWPDTDTEHKLLLIQESHSIVCSSTGMTVTLPKPLLKDSNINREDLSLMESRCCATENATHYVLSTDFNSCGTQRTLHDMYTNKIVLNMMTSEHYNKPWGHHGNSYNSDPDTVSEQMEGSGSGFGVELDTFVDDEDLHGRKRGVTVDISCELPGPTVNPRPQVVIAQVDFRLELFKDRDFTRPLANLPNNRHITEGAVIFVQARVNTRDPNLQSMIKTCNVTSVSTVQEQDENHLKLFKNGCIMHLKQLNLLPDGHRHEKRFSFEMHDYWKDGSPPQVVCELVVCSTAPGLNSQVPKCISQDEFCLKSSMEPSKDPLVIAQPQTVRSSHLLVIGPLRDPGIFDSEPVPEMPSADQSTDESVMNSPHASTNQDDVPCDRVVRVEGLDSGTVVGIAFAAFVIGVLLTGALWYIHTHTGPASRRNNRPRSAETSGESTPSSTAPITIHQIHRFNPPLHHCAILPACQPHCSAWHRTHTSLTTLHHLILSPLFRLVRE